MKLRKIRVPEFVNSDDFGSFNARDVEILFDPSENEITSDNFDQKKHSFFLSAEEIERLTREAAQRFLDQNSMDILKGVRKFKRREVNAVKVLLKISGAELGDLIGLEKSSISRILSGKQDLQRDKAMLLLQRVQDELEHPGKSKILLEKLRDGVAAIETMEQVCISAIKIAEFFIRKFIGGDGPITHLKLQKLLYYAQGVGFSRANLKLIREPVLAWEHGPVIREVYDHYRDYGSAALPANSGLDLSEVSDNESVQAVLDETVSLYGVYDAWYLRQKTHVEPPWLETNRDEVITDEKMIRFFKKVLM